MLEIGRQDMPRRASLFAWVKPKRPVPPEHIFEIGGRIDPTGASSSRSTRRRSARAARAIAAAGIDAVAIVLLHSYANSGARAARRARSCARSIPDALVSLSSDVLPVFREYERSMTTILNVYVMPAVSTYVARLERRIARARASPRRCC